jgi:hypothetical protein
MAAMLYDSLHSKLLTLPDDVEVWPAHGAGSACGKNISKDRSSTIGIQRRTNYALAPMTREEFVKMLTTDIAAPPPYFAKDAAMNREGARPLSEVHAPHLEPSAALAYVEEGALAVDVRDAVYFAASHVPSSINIGLGGQFASWAGTLLSFDDRIIVIAEDESTASEAVMRLARVGLENVAGWIAFCDWPYETARFRRSRRCSSTTTAPSCTSSTSEARASTRRATSPARSMCRSTSSPNASTRSKRMRRSP